MDRFRIGIAGAGLIAETAHIPAIMKSQNISLEVIIEKDSSRARQILKNIGIKVPLVNKLQDYDKELDGIVICTPNDSHKELALECLDRGINVLVEKPLATCYTDALEINSKSNLLKLNLMTGYCTRFWPSTQYLKNLIDSKVLGNISRFIFQYGSTGGWAPVSNYFLSKELSGGGAFIINGTHYLDRMIWFFGTPDSFTFMDDAEGGIEANAVAEFFYNNRNEKFNGQLRVSKTVNLQPGCVIEFENATIIHKDWSDPVITVRFNDEKIQHTFSSSDVLFRLSTRPDMYLLQLEEFICKSLNRYHNCISDIENAIEVVKITEDLYKIRKPLKCN